MPIRLVRSAVLVLFAIPAACGWALAQDSESLDLQVDELFSDCSGENTPGFAVAIVRDGEVLYQPCYGMADIAGKVPVTNETVFDIASTSKHFTAMSIAILSLRQDLSLRDPVRKWVPELPERWDPVRIDHLVYHTSGNPDYDTGSATDAAAVLADLAIDEEFEFAPGSAYSYNNAGYFLLGVIVERVTGKSLRKFAEETLFHPLGMTSTVFLDDAGETPENRAVGHEYDEKAEEWKVKESRNGVVGDGSLHTTISDMIRWTRHFDRDPLGFGDELVRLVTRSGTRDDGTPFEDEGKPYSYGFGLELGTHRGLSVVQHGGFWDGFTSHFLWFPDRRFFVIVLSNQSDFAPGGRALQIAELYLADEFAE